MGGTSALRIRAFCKSLPETVYFVVKTAVWSVEGTVTE